MLKLVFKSFIISSLVPISLFGQQFDSDSYFPFYLNNDTSCTITVEEFYYQEVKKTFSKNTTITWGPDTIKTYTFDSSGHLVQKINGDTIYSKSNKESIYVSIIFRNDSTFYVFNDSNTLIHKHTIDFDYQIQSDSYYYDNGLIKTLKTQYGNIRGYNYKTQKKDTIYRTPILSNFEYRGKRLLRVTNDTSEFRYTYPNKNQVEIELYLFDYKKVVYKWIVKKQLVTHR